MGKEILKIQKLIPLQVIPPIFYFLHNLPSIIYSLYGKYLTCKIVGQTSLLVKPMSQIIPTVHQKKYDFIFKSNI